LPTLAKQDSYHHHPPIPHANFSVQVTSYHFCLRGEVRRSPSLPVPTEKHPNRKEQPFSCQRLSLFISLFIFAGYQWFTPVILATQKTEIRRIAI
jgi:hypothetical protein